GGSSPSGGAVGGASNLTTPGDVVTVNGAGVVTQSAGVSVGAGVILSAGILADDPSQLVTAPITIPSVFTYYVNSVTGNDSNNGTSFATPFLTIAHTLAALSAGNTVCLESGSVWHENFRVALNNIGVYACGTGARPLLDASDVI